MYQQLKMFREITGIENTPGHIVRDTTDELVEVLDEIESGNTHALLAEFSDIVIYAINYLEQCGLDAKSAIERAGQDALAPKHPEPHQAVSSVFSALAYYTLHKDISAIALTAHIMLSAINAHGYNAVQCVTEKCKVINSRQGAYDASKQKWCKDENQDPDTIYKPDFDSCRK